MTREKTQMQRLEERLMHVTQQNLFLHGVIEGLREKPNNAGKERNTDATCETCAYCTNLEDDILCCKDPMPVDTISQHFCSHHPDFWQHKKGTEAEQEQQVKEGRT